MLRELFAAALALLPAAVTLPTPATTTATPVEEKVLKCLDAWLKAYRTGKIEFVEQKSILKESLAKQYGVLPKEMLGVLTYERELNILIEQAVALDTAEAANTVLEFGTVGLDAVKYTRAMSPNQVRGVAEKHLVNFKSPEAKEVFAKAARGEMKGDKVKSVALHAAGLRALGLFKDPTARATMEQQLGSQEKHVRLAAAEALGNLADENSAEPLGAALGRESDDVVVEAIIAAVRRCYAKYDSRLVKPKSEEPAKGDKPADATKPGAGDKPAEPPKPGEEKPAEVPKSDVPKSGTGEKPSEPPKPGAGEKPAEPPKAGEEKPADSGKAKAGEQPATPKAGETSKVPDLPESSRLVVRAAIKALGRTSWRGDMALVSFLQDFRSAETIPSLIDILQRFKDHPEEVLAGKLSGLLLHRAHETLVSLSGAIYSADQPEKWREFWEKEKEHFTLPPKPDPKNSEGTVAGMFGIPVQGSRVLFIVDLSGSMGFMMPGFAMPKDEKNEKNADVPSRLQLARHELLAAINSLPETTSFNFITYNGNPKAEVWNKDLLLASKKNKEKAVKFVEKMHADGGTNMWAGLEEGLKMKSLVYGDRYESNVDEVFVVSDGGPSVGEVIDPIEILRIVTETNQFSKVRINTIFITSNNERDPKGMSLTPSDLMQRMAEQNGGRFIKLVSK